MTEQSMIERVAAAVYKADGLGTKEDAQRIARAAIMAMREPTGTMLIAAERGIEGPAEELFVAEWRLMIDAALAN